MGCAVADRHRTRVEGNIVTEERIPLDMDAVEQALDEPIEVPDTCICAYVRLVPYHSVQRRLNPDCTAHTPEDDGVIEKERD